MKKILFILIAIALSSCDMIENRKSDLIDPHAYCRLKYEEHGKSIGRTAMVLYLQRSKQIDSVEIELSRLFAIEDSLDEID